MKAQIVVEKEVIRLQLVEKGDVMAESLLAGNRLSETLLTELDKLLKENKIEKNQLDGVEVLSYGDEGGNSRIARIISAAGVYCLTKQKKSIH